MNKFLKRLLILPSIIFIGYSLYQIPLIKNTLRQNITQKVVTIETIYGNFPVHEQVIIDLINSKTMQRIKKVEQYGASFFLKYKENPNMSYSRYEHCLGVWALLRKFGASLEEQIAGLLHDASHTAFSHTGDYLFNLAEQKDSYQDNIHEWYLKQTDVPEILAKHNITLEDILHKNGSHCMLEQDLPHICADRLEYNLYGGYLEGMLSKHDIEKIIQATIYDHEKKQWAFTDSALAEKLAQVPLKLSITEWGGVDTYFINTWMAQALISARDAGIITNDDIHFSTDKVLWDKLMASNNKIVQEKLQQALNYRDSYQIVTEQEATKHIKTKLRAIDPLIKTGDNSYKKLSELSSSYAQKLENIRNEVTKGWHVVFKNYQV